jgi:hypothetical protein
VSDEVVVDCTPSGAGWTCHVTVRGTSATTTHEVTVGAVDLGRLDPDAPDPTDLVGRSFAFLLEREPNTSILRRFDVTIIGGYFPDWERSIRG